MIMSFQSSDSLLLQTIPKCQWLSSEGFFLSCHNLVQMCRGWGRSSVPPHIFRDMDSFHQVTLPIPRALDPPLSPLI